MTDADALSELTRVGLRNPARIVVKVQSKRGEGSKQTNKSREVVEERRIPAKSVCCLTTISGATEFNEYFAHSLQIFYIECHASEKLVQLTRVVSYEISKNQSSQFIVYFATCACVDYFYRVAISKCSLACVTYGHDQILAPLLPKSTTLHSLHGHLHPPARTRTLTAFSTSVATPTSPAMLLATDVAARGLDLPHVDVVIQFDPPSDPKAFSHRCGRTARAGRSGRAYVLLAGREAEYIGELIQSLNLWRTSIIHH